MKKIEKNLNSIVWDTTKTWAYYPEKLKNLYKEIYLKNYKNYSIWINEISKNNVDNINWWLTVPASRDERISNLFHKICIFLTIKNFKNKNYKLIVITNSRELKKKIFEEKKFYNVQINLVSDINFFKKAWILFKETLLLNINLSLIKIKSTNKKTNILNLIDIFEIEEKNNYSFYGNFLRKNFPKNNYNLVPTFLTFSPFKIYKLLQQKRNFFFKENEISFIDFFSILKNFIFSSLVLNKSFLNNNFDSLIREEIRIDNNFRSILIANLNYRFFKNLKKKILKFIKLFHGLKTK